MRGVRSIVFLEVDLSAKAPDGRLSNRAECRCFASRARSSHSSALTTFGRASPSAVAEQANSALEPTALRAAAHRQAVRRGVERVVNRTCRRRSPKDAIPFIVMVMVVLAVVTVPLLEPPARMVLTVLVVLMYLPGLLFIIVGAIREPSSRDYLRSVIPDMYRAHPFSQVKGVLRVPGAVLAVVFGVAFALSLPVFTTYGAIRFSVYRILRRPLPYEKQSDSPSA